MSSKKNNLRTIRQELKYYINVNNIVNLRNIIGEILDSDSNIEQSTKDYKVRSLYFDTIYNKDLNEKLDGILLRKKVRIRVYNDDSIIKLEFKNREGTSIDKTTIIISKEEANEIINGNYNIFSKNHVYSNLLENKNDFPLWLAKAKLKSIGYRPRVIVEYDREAYTMPHGNTRITIDKNLRTYNNQTDLFNINNTSSPIFLNNIQILEVKFSNYLPKVVQYVLNCVDAVPHSISKYVLCQRYMNSDPWSDRLVVPS